MKLKVTVDFVLDLNEVESILDQGEYVFGLFNDGYWGSEAIAVTNVQKYETIDDNIEERHHVRIEAAELVKEIDEL